MSLHQLKKIRSQRVERVYSELQRFKSFYIQAEEALQQAKFALRDYGLWRVDQEKLMFERLQSDFFSPDEIRDYNLTLESQKQEEVRLEKEIPAYEEKLKEAQKKLATARTKLQLATKDMEKADEFIDLQEKEDAIIEEKQEENVADELSCFKSSQK